MRAHARPKVTDEYVVEAYGAGARPSSAPSTSDLVVLDADLASDCRVRAFELAYPDRFVECGHRRAGHGLDGRRPRPTRACCPSSNSFASFLASRANEQIYNQASEGTKVVYALHYAGLIPAGPGKSHQSIRDISLLGALPDMTVVQPCNAEETRALLRWAVEEAEESVAIRLAIGPSPRRIELDGELSRRVGAAVVLREGATRSSSPTGPVMLHEALTASELLAERGRRPRRSWTCRG